MTCENRKCNCSEKSNSKSLWFAVVLAFVILIVAWTYLIKTAVKNKPEVIEVDNTSAKEAVQAEP